MDLVTRLLFVAAFGLLIGGAEAWVRGASRLACSLGVSPRIVGLTIVALGTSSPELAGAIQSSLTGGKAALGHVVGWPHSSAVCSPRSHCWPHGKPGPASGHLMRKRGDRWPIGIKKRQPTSSSC